jgi:hypothetical protein
LTNASTATFQNNVAVNAGGIVDFGGGGTIIGGTGAFAATIANSGTVRFSANTVSHSYVRGFDNAHKVICTGSNWDWDYGGAASFVDIKWVDLQLLTIGGTGGSGITIEALGDCNIQAMLVTAADTFKCITVSTTLTGDPTKDMFMVNGTLQLIGAAGTPITVTGYKYLDAYSGAGVFINWQYVNFTCANVATACPALFQIDTNLPTISNCNFTAGAASDGVYFEIGLRMTLSTCTFVGGAGTDQYSQNLYLWDDGELQMTGSTFTTLGLDGTWDGVAMLTSKNHGGVANAWKYYGTYNTSTPDAGYKASDWIAATNVTLSNADAYGLIFSTSIVLDQNATQCNNFTTDMTTVFSINAGNTFTGNGDAVSNGVITASNATFTARSMTISATGIYTATSATTYITDADAADIAWSNEGTFNNSVGTVAFLGHLSPFKILGDNLWNVLEIVVADGPTYLFEGNHTQTVTTYCHMNGNSTDALTIDSTDANDWFLTLSVGCVQDFAYLTVDQSDASGGLTCVAAFSTDMLTNTNWIFGGPGVYIWDGGGPNNLASNRFNWTGDITPGATADCFYTAASNKACTWDIASNSGHIQVDINYTNTITMNNGVTWSTLDIAACTWATNGMTIGILGQLTASDTSAITTTAASRISTGSHLNISGTATVGNNVGYDLLLDGDLNQSGGDFYAPSSTGVFTMSGDFWNRTGGTWHNDGGTVQFTTIATTSPTAAETFWGVSIAGTATFDTTVANFGITILEDIANAGSLIMNGSLLTLGTTTHTTIFTNTGIVTVGTSTMRILNLCSAVLVGVPEFTVISFQGPAGWLYSHDHDGIANEDHYFGQMNTSDAPAGYQAINWTDAKLHIREADVYTNPFPTKITLDELGASWVQKIIYANTQFTIDQGASMA